MGRLRVDDIVEAWTQLQSMAIKSRQLSLLNRPNVYYTNRVCGDDGLQKDWSKIYYNLPFREQHIFASWWCQYLCSFQYIHLG